ncbi:pyridoxal phosphate-dependent aminotransferase [Hufsiella ginkgonis]|uniref:Aminotransferase class I/II-fold pyridoxal phosphate-dependent enzyme n=1 Tax=Hufsiella ginkgonis TaxID=2695274 RepID=A0A7K1XUM8_9SPHI|nr:histidinol-phosphate transaminase [Hufsiella ginkgonis]MXV14670.1 aminotransferase class I/II-fold pyridoxal phosphate-dependent enzyme [Hufsiella ginkgonis]
MANQMDRRSWIKSSAFLAGSVAFFSGSFNTAAAKTRSLLMPKGFTALSDFAQEEQELLNAPAEITARLSSNENPFGPSPKAKKAIMEGIDGSFRYGFGGTRQLTARISEFEGLGPGMVSLSPGSSPFLKAGAAHFSKGGGSIITGDPSYDDLTRTAAGMGAKIVKVPLTADYKLDLDAMEKAIDGSTKLVYIVNPNNPTATTVDTAKLKSFIERVSPKVTVFVDEAYIDYVKDPKSATTIDCVKKGMNVVVIRTFSKLYGFAGLRMGYMVAQPAMIQALGEYTDGAFSISSLSVNAAVASYQDRDFMTDALAKTAASKQFLYDTLKKEGYEYIPSDANFVLFPVKMEAKKFTEEMSKRGVQLRNWKFSGKEWCRVSIGTMDEMKAFAAAFTQIA